MSTSNINSSVELNQQQKLPSLSEVVNKFTIDSHVSAFERSFNEQLLQDNNREDVEFTEDENLSYKFTNTTASTIKNTSLLLLQEENDINIEESINNFLANEWEAMPEIIEMEKRKENNSLFDVEDDEEEMEEKLGQQQVEEKLDFLSSVEKMKEIHDLKITQGTSYMRNYALRMYKQYYNSRRNDQAFIDYQPKPFPIKKCTFILVFGLLCMDFVVFVRERHFGDPKKDYGPYLYELLRGLLRKFGNYIDKVYPCLNYCRDKIIQSLDLNTVYGKRVNAIVRQARARGLRGDTFEYCTLKDITWSKNIIQDDNGVDKWFIITTDLWIVKDKRLTFITTRNQRVHGRFNLSKCANIALLIYLADHRQVFEAGSSVNVIKTNNFNLRPGYGNLPMFSKLYSPLPMSAKDLNNIVKYASDAVNEDIKITFRSMRSGCLCQAFLEDLAENKVIREETVTAMMDHIGWKNRRSMDPYIRWVVMKFRNVTALQEPGEKDAANLILKSTLKEIRNENEEDAKNYIKTLNLADGELRELMYFNNRSKVVKSKIKKNNWIPDDSFMMTPPAKMRMYYLLKEGRWNDYLLKELKNSDNYFAFLEFQKLKKLTHQQKNDKLRRIKTIWGGNELIIAWNDQQYYDYIEKYNLFDVINNAEKLYIAPKKQIERKNLPKTRVLKKLPRLAIDDSTDSDDDDDDDDDEDEYGEKFKKLEDKQMLEIKKLRRKHYLENTKMKKKQKFEKYYILQNHEKQNEMFDKLKLEFNQLKTLNNTSIK
ncbi:hypothetical protein ABK040_006760 [Willaertia magna]